MPADVTSWHRKDDVRSPGYRAGPEPLASTHAGREPTTDRYDNRFKPIGVLDAAPGSESLGGPSRI